MLNSSIYFQVSEYMVQILKCTLSESLRPWCNNGFNMVRAALYSISFFGFYIFKFINSFLSTTNRGMHYIFCYQPYFIYFNSVIISLASKFNAFQSSVSMYSSMSGRKEFDLFVRSVNSLSNFSNSSNS